MTRLNQIVCPNCKTTLNSKAGVPVGQMVPCPKCKEKFEVKEPEVVDEFEVVEDEPATPPPAKKAPSNSPKKGSPSKINKLDDEDEKPRPAKRRAVEEDDDEPRPAKRRPIEDDDEDRPRAKSKRRDDDDDDDDLPRTKKRARSDDDYDDDYDRPRKKKRVREDEELGTYGKLKHNIYVRVSVLVVLLATAGILGYFLYQKNKKQREEPQDENAPAVNNQISPSQTQRTLGTSGILTKVEGNSITLNIFSQSGAMTSKTYPVTTDATILLNNKTVKLSELVIGRNMTYTLDDQNQIIKIVQSAQIIPK